MTGKSITLHIGASKCGSSALQTQLSASPIIHRVDGSQINYAIFDVKNNSITDKERLISGRGMHGYKVSPNAKDLMSMDFKKIRKNISEYPTDLLFSSEGWLFQPSEWKEILKKLDLNVNIIVYVRPQVSVLNSAWWQWGAWSDQVFEDWMQNRLNASLWGERIKRWAQLDHISSLTVRPVPTDIIPDFYENVLKASKPDTVTRPNPSLPGPVLRLFQRNRSLRKGIHSSGIDFALSNVIKMEDPSIWVLNEDFIERILAKTKNDNELLMSFMDEPASRHVRDDPHWWSASAYKDKIYEEPHEQSIPPEKLEEMCVKMASAIYEIQAKHLKNK